MPDEHVAARLLELIRDVGSAVSLDDLLQRLAQGSLELVDARWAAVGLPDDSGRAFRRFVSAGLTDAEIAAIGWLPHTHGLLGSLLTATTSTRLDDVRTHARFSGWPDTHPEMVRFVGVPIVAHDDVVAACYVSRGPDAAPFTADDTARLERLAEHAAVLLENALLLERSRSLAIAEERARLARELHDAVSQTVFGIRLTARSARAAMAEDPPRAAEELDRVTQLAGQVLGELRSVIHDLRPAELERDGLVATLRSVTGLAQRAGGVDVRLVAALEDEPPIDVGAALVRIAQEAVSNAVRHADAGHIDVELHQRPDGRVRLSVRDDGRGFDPGLRRVATRRLGLTSMRERAAEVGGALEVDSAPGRGTRVRVDVPAPRSNAPR